MGYGATAYGTTTLASTNDLADVDQRVQRTVQWPTPLQRTAHFSTPVRRTVVYNQSTTDTLHT